MFVRPIAPRRAACLGGRIHRVIVDISGEYGEDYEAHDADCLGQAVNVSAARATWRKGPQEKSEADSRVFQSPPRFARVLKRRLAFQE